MGKDASANAVELMALRRQHSCFQSEHLHGPAIFHTPLLLVWIDLIDHLRIIDMYFVGADSNNWAWIELKVSSFVSVITASIACVPYLLCISQIFQVYRPFL